MLRRRRALFGVPLFVMVVCLAGLYLYRPARSEQPAEFTASPPAGSSDPMLVTKSRARAVPAEAASDQLAATLKALDFGPLTPDVSDAAKRSKTLAAFLGYRKRIPVDEQDQARYHEILASTAELRTCRQELLYPADRRDPSRQQIGRLLWIDFLRESSSWLENPQRLSFLAMVEDILLTDSIDAGMSEPVKQSLAANKLELFELLAAQDPERAARVLERGKGTRQEKLFAFFADQLQQAKRQESPQLN